MTTSTPATSAHDDSSRLTPARPIRPAPRHRNPPSPGALAARYDVAVVGMGYVGLPTALALHAAGRRVLGVEVSAARVYDIARGSVDLGPSDAARLRRAVADPDRFALTRDPAAVSGAAGVLVCVPTPVDEHLVPDLSSLSAACDAVARHAVAGQTLVLTSTSYVGCTRDLLTAPLAERGLRAGEEVFVAFSAERIDPGRDLPPEDVPRVVGGVTPRCSEEAAALLGGCARTVHRVSSAEAAELTKLYENCFRAVNIALANELADICGALDVDVAEVIQAASTKPYGFMAFRPGPGVGGHCIPCDPHYLLWQLHSRRVAAPLLETAMAAVALRPGRVVARAKEVLAARGRAVSGARVLVLGVTYKSGVADVRESPALEILAALRRAGAEVAYSDALMPHVSSGGLDLDSVPRPADEPWDLVIAHTVQPDDELSWLERQTSVLDATYRLDDIPHRELP